MYISVHAFVYLSGLRTCSGTFLLPRWFPAPRLFGRLGLSDSSCRSSSSTDGANFTPSRVLAPPLTAAASAASRASRFDVCSVVSTIGFKIRGNFISYRCTTVLKGPCRLFKVQLCTIIQLSRNDPALNLQPFLRLHPSLQLSANSPVRPFLFSFNLTVLETGESEIVITIVVLQRIIKRIEKDKSEQSDE